jgi:SAM-dependent methyltransferase
MIAMQKLLPTIGTRSRRHPTCTPSSVNFLFTARRQMSGAAAAVTRLGSTLAVIRQKVLMPQKDSWPKRGRHPEVHFSTAILPGLDGIAESSFANVLCETVIMHLDPEAITPAVERLLAILVPGGILYLSWRVTEGTDRRDEHGRLYAAFDPERVLRALTATQVLLDEQVGSVSSGKLIRRIVARKQSAEN